ncbi:MAG: family 43 glycosylhydrolase [Kiritimatiellaeota bacterium]|nr:family 43 glycosylhydrolase [Kiritimatiellota bacterium]
MRENPVRCPAVFLIAIAVCISPARGGPPVQQFRRQDVRIRDPFIVPVPGDKVYYMFGTTDPNCWGDVPGVGFNVFASRDLETWTGPQPAFRPPPGFWADHNFWAPEVHRYRGRWWMFASFKSTGRPRGTQILVSDHIQGPYCPVGDGPVTPPTWECLDGTLYVDPAGKPWMVFCHEWVQVQDGEICAMRLSSDLHRAEGDPILLFRGSDAPWAPHPPNKKDYVTDGPFLYRAETGDLLMLWSSFGASGYAVGTARSTSGRITGPWIQDPEPLFAHDGGHAMVFRTFDGRLMLALHKPNRTPLERPRFLPLVEQDGRLRLATAVE